MNHNHLAVTELLENNINHLPITAQDVMTMIRRRGWKIFQYDLNNAEDVEKINTFKVMKAVLKYGIFLWQYKDMKVVFCPINQASDSLAYNLAHELGHIICGHISEYEVLGFHDDSTMAAQEIEANNFARALTAPYCILKKIHATSKEDIDRYTFLNCHQSALRAEEFRKHKRRYTNEEKKLINNFKNYIDKTNEKSNVRKIIFISALLLVISNLCSVCLLR